MAHLGEYSQSNHRREKKSPKFRPSVRSAYSSATRGCQTWERGSKDRLLQRARMSVHDGGRLNYCPHIRDQGRPHPILHQQLTEWQQGNLSPARTHSSFGQHFLRGNTPTSPQQFSPTSAFSASEAWNHSFPREAASSRSKFDLSKFAREKAAALERINLLPKNTQLTGWRAKLAREGFDSVPKKDDSNVNQQKRWNYVDSEDEALDGNGFVFAICVATQTEEKQKASNLEHRTVSRKRKMQIEVRKVTFETNDATTQVKFGEFDSCSKSNEKKKQKQRFMPSRLCSWYRNGSYNKYVSAVPWRSKSCSEFVQSSPGMKNSGQVPEAQGYREICGDGQESKECNSNDESSYTFHQAVHHNTDLPPGSKMKLLVKSHEAIRKTKKRNLLATSMSSGEGSANETGYDSHSPSLTDSDKKVNRSRLTSCSPSSDSVEVEETDTELNLTEEIHGIDISDSATDSPINFAVAENFHLNSANEYSSQRDSGFLESFSGCDSPFGETCQIDPIPGLSEEKTTDSRTRKEKSNYISDCRDIDNFLLGEKFGRDSSSFEDFERRAERSAEIRSREESFETAATHWSEYLKSSGLSSGLEAFIENCRDDGDALLADSDCASVSDDPDLEWTLVREVGGGSSSTTVASVQGNQDVADISWLEEFDKPENSSGRGKHKQSARLRTKLDDCTLQLHRYNNGSGQGDYGGYLDLESTVDEQTEEFEDFHSNRKNAVILRTQLSVRVHAIIEKLVNSTGRELRRSLFSLKQIFQDDKDLVHEFVRNDGLACLIKVGSEADQNYQNYILRAMGQVMLYVDGMNGVIEYNETIQWLYSLIASKYRLVVKTALKLLLVFVEYTETNSQLLINAVSIVDADNGTIPWSNIMNLLKEKDSADMELLVYAATLINKTLNGIPDQDTYYDVVDVLEEQGMEHVIQYYMSKQGTDLDLLQQFQIYEAVMKHEDGVPDNKPLPLDARLRQVPRSRKSYPCENDRRKSRRHSVGTVSSSKQSKHHNHSLEKMPEESPFVWQDDRNQRIREDHTAGTNCHNQNMLHMNGDSECLPVEDENGITPALRRRRRERDARNKSLIKEQEQNCRESSFTKMNSVSSSASSENIPLVKEVVPFQSIVERRRSCFENNIEAQNQKNISKSKYDRASEKEKEIHVKTSDDRRQNFTPYTRNDSNNKKAWMFSMMYAKSQDDDRENSAQHEATNKKSTSPVDSVNNNVVSHNTAKSEDVKSHLKKDGSVKDIQEKYCQRRENGVRSPSSDNCSRLGDTSGIISRAKEGLVASTTRLEQRNISPADSPNSKLLETKKLDNGLQWEQLMKSMKRPLIINDLDFTDLREEEDIDFLPNGDIGQEDHEFSPPPQLFGVGPPPPPPPLPLGGGPVPPPPPPQEPNPNLSSLGSKNSNSFVPPVWVRRNQHQSQEPPRDAHSKTLQKTKKTVKLFWREVKEDRSLLQRIGKKKTIWDELKTVTVDTQKLEHLFENRAKDVMNKEKTQEGSKKHEIIVLDTKRSNAINIGMTKLPPPRTIKTAILKMDSTIMNREGIEKILTMLPTEDEKSKIAEAQMSNPDIPLGTAEQFLLTLSSISELEARLRLWAFRLDYDSIEKEVAEPLMDLKQAVEEIEKSESFRVILSTLRSIGNFLNGNEIKGFHIEYLSKVPEVKDTVQKHSLLHHLCHLVMEKFPKSSDLYSEIGSVTRASKVDYGEVSRNMNKMESECKASWDYLKAIAKHDCSIAMKVRISEFLTDCAERIIVLKVIHRRMINRYHKFLVYLGCSTQCMDDMPIQKTCKVLSEFALEYRTTRERVLQQLEKKANHRERNKTRGKMITDMDKFRTKEQQADHELRQLLGNGNVNGDDQKMQKWGTVPGVRGRVKSSSNQGGSLGRHSAPAKDEGLTDADDEILETLVKTATTHPSRNEPRIRKKARYGDRKSLRRTLKNGLSEEERSILSTMTT